MSRLQTFSTRLYAALLPLYPPDLRRDFGPEMAEIFVLDMEEAIRRRGLAGALRIWRCSAKELLRIALPAHFENPAVAVPCIIFVLCETVFSAQLMLAFSHQSVASASMPMEFETIPAFIMWPSLVAALTALVAVLAGDRGLPVWLNLGAR